MTNARGRKLLCLFLSLVMVLGLFPTFALADEPGEGEDDAVLAEEEISEEYVPINFVFTDGGGKFAEGATIDREKFTLGVADDDGDAYANGTYTPVAEDAIDPYETLPNGTKNMHTEFSYPANSRLTVKLQENLGYRAATLGLRHAYKVTLKPVILYPDRAESPTINLEKDLSDTAAPGWGYGNDTIVIDLVSLIVHNTDTNAVGHLSSLTVTVDFKPLTQITDDFPTVEYVSTKVGLARAPYAEADVTPPPAETPMIGLDAQTVKDIMAQTSPENQDNDDYRTAPTIVVYEVTPVGTTTTARLGEKTRTNVPRLNITEKGRASLTRISAMPTVNGMYPIPVEVEEGKTYYLRYQTDAYHYGLPATVTNPYVDVYFDNAISVQIVFQFRYELTTGVPKSGNNPDPNIVASISPNVNTKQIRYFVDKDKPINSITVTLNSNGYYFNDYSVSTLMAYFYAQGYYGLSARLDNPILDDLNGNGKLDTDKNGQFSGEEYYSDTIIIEGTLYKEKLVDEELRNQVAKLIVDLKPVDGTHAQTFTGAKKDDYKLIADGTNYDKSSGAVYCIVPKVSQNKLIRIHKITDKSAGGVQIGDDEVTRIENGTIGGEVMAGYDATLAPTMIGLDSDMEFIDLTKLIKTATTVHRLNENDQAGDYTANQIAMYEEIFGVTSGDYTEATITANLDTFKEKLANSRYANEFDHISRAADNSKITITPDPLSGLATKSAQNAAFAADSYLVRYAANKKYSAGELSGLITLTDGKSPSKNHVLYFDVRDVAADDGINNGEPIYNAKVLLRESHDDRGNPNSTAYGEYEAYTGLTGIAYIPNLKNDANTRYDLVVAARGYTFGKDVDVKIGDVAGLLHDQVDTGGQKVLDDGENIIYYRRSVNLASGKNLAGDTIITETGRLVSVVRAEAYREVYVTYLKDNTTAASAINKYALPGFVVYQSAGNQTVVTDPANYPKAYREYDVKLTDNRTVVALPLHDEDGGIRYELPDSPRDQWTNADERTAKGYTEDRIGQIALSAEGTNATDNKTVHYVYKNWIVSAIDPQNEKVYKVTQEIEPGAPIQNNITVYPNFEEEYQVKYIATLLKGTDEQILFVEKNKYADENVRPKYTNSGYTFGFWHLDGKKQAFDFDTEIGQDTILYAEWIPGNGVVITFYAIQGNKVVPIRDENQQPLTAVIERGSSMNDNKSVFGNAVRLANELPGNYAAAVFMDTSYVQTKYQTVLWQRKTASDANRTNVRAADAVALPNIPKASVTYDSPIHQDMEFYVNMVAGTRVSLQTVDHEEATPWIRTKLPTNMPIVGMKDFQPTDDEETPLVDGPWRGWSNGRANRSPILSIVGDVDEDNNYWTIGTIANHNDPSDQTMTTKLELFYEPDDGSLILYAKWGSTESLTLNFGAVTAYPQYSAMIEKLKLGNKLNDNNEIVLQVGQTSSAATSFEAVPDGVLIEQEGSVKDYTAAKKIAQEMEVLDRDANITLVFDGWYTDPSFESRYQPIQDADNATGFGGKPIVSAPYSVVKLNETPTSVDDDSFENEIAYPNATRPFKTLYAKWSEAYVITVRPVDALTHKPVPVALIKNAWEEQKDENDEVVTQNGIPVYVLKENWDKVKVSKEEKVIDRVPEQKGALIPYKALAKMNTIAGADNANDIIGYNFVMKNDSAAHAWYTEDNLDKIAVPDENQYSYDLEKFTFNGFLTEDMVGEDGTITLLASEVPARYIVTVTLQEPMNVNADKYDELHCDFELVAENGTEQSVVPFEANKEATLNGRTLRKQYYVYNGTKLALLRSPKDDHVLGYSYDRDGDVDTAFFADAWGIHGSFAVDALSVKADKFTAQTDTVVAFANDSIMLQGGNDDGSAFSISITAHELPNYTVKFATSGQEPVSFRLQNITTGEFVVDKKGEAVVLTVDPAASEISYMLDEGNYACVPMDSEETLKVFSVHEENTEVDLGVTESGGTPLAQAEKFGVKITSTGVDDSGNIEYEAAVSGTRDVQTTIDLTQYVSGEVGKATVAIPANVLAVYQQGEDDLTLKTANAEITIPNVELKNLTGPVEIVVTTNNRAVLNEDVKTYYKTADAAVTITGVSDYSAIKVAPFVGEALAGEEVNVEGINGLYSVYNSGMMADVSKADGKFHITAKDVSTVQYKMDPIEKSANGSSYTWIYLVDNNGNPFTADFTNEDQLSYYTVITVDGQDSFKNISQQAFAYPLKKVDKFAAYYVGTQLTPIEGDDDLVITVYLDQLPSNVKDVFANDVVRPVLTEAN